VLKITSAFMGESCSNFIYSLALCMIVTLWYGTVRLVRRTEEEKYGTDI